ncbi:uncharacterized protein LOC130801484 isoform X4 [Amaranthus tricolor]|uniref:uncharacterized protein LOC130801484 isoform X4 n=1 Tax=Amaranthus tricolor TaxID=29722 RepID=UPI00258F35E4|nr:uncharacterized protein LOC130801484 isoform X4 [Amaranthus tricolor]
MIEIWYHEQSAQYVGDFGARYRLLCFFLNKVFYGGRTHVYLRDAYFTVDVVRLEARKKRPFGPTLNFSAEEAVSHQLDALKYNDQPHQDYGIEVLYRFAGFDPFERSTYFGPHFDLGQDRFKQRVWVQGTRPGQEEIFEFTMVQKLGGCWDGYWLTESLHHDGDSFSGGMAY